VRSGFNTEAFQLRAHGALTVLSRSGCSERRVKADGDLTRNFYLEKRGKADAYLLGRNAGISCHCQAPDHGNHGPEKGRLREICVFVVPLYTAPALDTRRQTARGNPR